MKKAIIILLFVLACLAGKAQIIKGTGVVYFDSIPNVNATTPQGAELAFGIKTKILYYWDRDSTKWKQVDSSVSTEEIQDIVGAMSTAGIQTGIQVTYDDITGAIDYVTDVTLDSLNTARIDSIYNNSDTIFISEGGNVYFTLFPTLYSGGAFSSGSTHDLLENPSAGYSTRFMNSAGAYMSILSDTADSGFLGWRWTTLRGTFDIGETLSEFRFLFGNDARFSLTNSLDHFYFGDELEIGLNYVIPPIRSTASRPASPSMGMLGYNSTTDILEWYSITDARWWYPIKTTLTGGDIPSTYVVRGDVSAGGVTATSGLTYSGTVLTAKSATRNFNFQNDVFNFLSGASFGNFTLQAAQFKIPSRVSVGSGSVYAALVGYLTIFDVRHSYTAISAQANEGTSAISFTPNTAVNDGHNGFFNTMNVGGVINDQDTNIIRSINIQPTLTSSGQYEAIRIRPIVTNTKGQDVYAIRSDTGKVVLSNYEFDVEQDLTSRDQEVLTLNETSGKIGLAPSPVLWNDFSTRTTSDTITVIQRQFIVLDATSGNITFGIDVSSLIVGQEILVNFRPNGNTITLETAGSELIMEVDGSTSANVVISVADTNRSFIWDGTNLRRGT